MQVGSFVFLPCVSSAMQVWTAPIPDLSTFAAFRIDGVAGCALCPRRARTRSGHSLPAHKAPPKLGSQPPMIRHRFRSRSRAGKSPLELIFSHPFANSRVPRPTARAAAQWKCPAASMARTVNQESPPTPKTGGVLLLQIPLLSVVSASLRTIIGFQLRLATSNSSPWPHSRTVLAPMQRVIKYPGRRHCCHAGCKTYFRLAKHSATCAHL